MITPHLVVGCGNPLMGDDGIGPRVVARLAELLPERADVEMVDAGRAGFRLLHLMAGRTSTLLVDAARMGVSPGTLRVFRLGDVEDRKVLPRVSVHEGNLLELLELAQRLGEAPGEVVFVGIEPARVTPGGELSPTLCSELEAYVAVVQRELDALAPLTA